MTDLSIFNYADTEIRTVVLGGEPWFVAADVTTVLGYGGGARNAIARLPERMKGVEGINTPGGRQQMTVISEPGVYRLAMRSNAGGAEAFQDWIAEDVVPAIRKAGRYEIEPAPAADITSIGRRELALMVIEAEDRAAAALAELQVATPKAEAWDHLATADGDYAVADAAKILCRHPLIKVGRDRLFTRMAGMGWVYRRELDRRWTVYQRAVEAGWLTELASSHYHPRTGELVLDAPQVRVTVKGLGELQKRLAGEQSAIGGAA